MPPRSLELVATTERDPCERLRIARELAESVARLHASGRVHGALAPGRVVVTDAGAVVVLPPPPAFESPLRRAGFDAPEVARGGRPTHRSDAFSAAALAWLVLSGRPAFDGDGPLARVQRALFSDPGPLRLAAPSASREVEEAVAAALDRRPRRRPSAARLAEALGAARSVAPPALSRRVTSTSPWLVAAALQALTRVRLADLDLTPARAGLVALALLLATVPFVRTDAALSREIGSLLERGDVPGARRRVDAAARARPDDPVIEKLRGDVACARGAASECLRRYRVALASRPGLRDDPALRLNARRLVQPDEACSTRRSAAHLLGELRDPEALPALERSRRAGGLLAFLCTGDALDRAITATRVAAPR